MSVEHENINGKRKRRKKKNRRGKRDIYLNWNRILKMMAEEINVVFSHSKHHPIFKTYFQSIQNFKKKNE